MYVFPWLPQGGASRTRSSPRLEQGEVIKLGAVVNSRGPDDFFSLCGLAGECDDVGSAGQGEGVVVEG